MSEETEKKMTESQKAGIAAWIRTQIKDAALDKEKIVEGTQIPISTLKNFLRGNYNVNDDKIRTFVTRIGELKVVKSHIVYCETYHRLENSDFLRLFNVCRKRYRALNEQDELTELIETNQTRISRILNEKAGLSAKEQMQILNYYYEKEPTIRTGLKEVIEQAVTRSNLYIMSDIALRDYRHLQYNVQQQLEKIMMGYLEVFAYNLDRMLDAGRRSKYSRTPYCLEDMIERFTENYCDKKETRISDTIKAYTDPGSYDLEDISSECRSLLQDHIEPEIKRLQKSSSDEDEFEDRYEKLNRLTLLKYALFALAKKDKESDLRSILTQAVIISLIDDHDCLDVYSQSEEFFEALDRFENALPFQQLCRSSRIDDPTCVKEYYYNFEQGHIRTAEYYRMEDEFMYSGFSAEELKMGYVYDYYREVLTTNINSFYDSLDKNTKQLLFDNMPAFINFETGIEFNRLSECFERFRKLDKDKFEQAAEKLRACPQVKPSFYDGKAEDIYDLILMLVDDPFAEISYCRKMMMYEFDPESSRKSQLTSKKMTDEKNIWLLFRIAEMFDERMDYMITNIAKQFLFKLKFTAEDWYLWQLIINAYHTGDFNRLYDILSQVQDETKQ